MTVKPPAVRPCPSCPYRLDVPSGVWAEEEYDKLPAYDLPTAEQPARAFMCHQQYGRLCAGWVACHDMNEALGLRMNIAAGDITPEDYDAILDYTTDVPLFASGAEAAAHGKRDRTPGPRAVQVIKKLERRKAGAKSCR